MAKKNGEKENVQIKGMVSMRMLILSCKIPKPYSMFVPIFKILSRVVPEKSLAEKKSIHTRTDKHVNGKDKNYIPRIYFVYRRV